MATSSQTRPARTPRRGRRLTTIGLVLLAVIAAGLWFRSALMASPQPGFRTAPVTIGSVRETVLATGILKPVKLVALGAQVSGRLIAVNVEVGQDVRKGDLLAEIDSLPQQNALRTAEATLQRARAERREKEATLAYAKATLARQERALAQNAISRDEYESALSSVRTTEAQIAALDADIKAAEVAVQTAEIDLDYTMITAPIDGTVLAVVTQEGQTVNAAQSAPTIVILGQLDVMTVRTEISEADIVKVQPGQKVEFTILGEPDRLYEATLEAVEPAPETITSDSSISSSGSMGSSSTATTTSAVYYIGTFDVPNPDRHLRTYMTAEVSIVTGEATDVLTVPSAALGPRNADGTYTIQVVEGADRIVERQVEIGLNDKVTAEVRSGLQEGERVVIGQLPAQAEQPAGPGRRSMRLF
jgi:macrolide-specific efflux system membrane fusion protein